MVDSTIKVPPELQTTNKINASRNEAAQERTSTDRRTDARSCSAAENSRPLRGPDGRCRTATDEALQTVTGRSGDASTDDAQGSDGDAARRRPHPGRRGRQARLRPDVERQENDSG
ncbi:hypothetical protein PSD17_04100 [Pseudonocardia sp. D17]|nr:hypothetical protein PSD17_04100 [Pseudonocardia sp. D17]